MPDTGKLSRRNMKKARLDLSEFLIQCRQQGFFDLGAIQTAVYEPDGRLTILPVAARRLGSVCAANAFECALPRG